MKVYQIWCEGFAVTGQSAGAQYMGESCGESFEDSCKSLLERELDKDEKRVIKSPPSIWGCKLYDNEKDARKYFG